MGTPLPIRAIRHSFPPFWDTTIMRQLGSDLVYIDLCTFLIAAVRASKNSLVASHEAIRTR
jgi:hypothetical protein